LGKESNHTMARKPGSLSNTLWDSLIVYNFWTYLH
jgi:hypothetical protein